MNSSSPRPLIIAHRGASGYLPEHTQEAKVLAHAQGADYLEQDIVLTKDDVPIVLHDIHLDTVTNVSQLFPGRCRTDGRFYAIDFMVDEIRELSVSERFDPQTGNAIFPNRFPAHSGRFQISTLDKELTLIRGLNQSTGRIAGIYPEIKQPKFHLDQGKDISVIVLETLQEHGYSDPGSCCYLQCFDSAELTRIRHDLGCRLQMIQLLEEKECNHALSSGARCERTMKEIAGYANGIGPSLNGVFQKGVGTELVPAAHAAGLVVHPWTYRVDAIPAGFLDFRSLHLATLQIGIDGVFTDFPDLTLKAFLSLGEGSFTTVARKHRGD